MALSPPGPVLKDKAISFNLKNWLQDLYSAILGPRPEVAPWSRAGGPRNLIINGNFQIWQRGTSHTAPATGSYTADRWNVSHSSDGVVDILQGTRYSMRTLAVDVTTADASIAAGQYYVVNQFIEGKNCAHVGWGTASAQPLTISFWHAHTVTGTYCINIRNNAVDQSYIAEYTQTEADNWEYSTVTIPAITSGTWLATNGIGIRVSFTVACGSTYQTTPGVWTSGNYLSSSNQVNGLNSTSNYCRFSEVQVEVGNQATDYEYRSYNEEMLLCQRYYQQSYNPETVPGTVVNAGSTWIYVYNLGSATHPAGNTIYFKVPMRDSATMAGYSPQTGTAAKAYDVANAADVNVTFQGQGMQSSQWFAASGGATVQAHYKLHWTATAEL